MAIAIFADDRDFSAMHYGLPRSSDREAIRERLENTARSFGLMGTDFYDRAIKRFESFDFGRIERKIDALSRTVRHMFDRDEITFMSSIGQFQQAGPEQARWTMANPRAKKLFEKDMIHGWRDIYKPAYSGRYGDDDPDYQQVMDGMAQFDEEGNSFHVEYLHLRDADNRTELTFGQQTAIIDVIWPNFEAWLDRGLDHPRDPDNGSL